MTFHDQRHRNITFVKKTSYACNPFLVNDLQKPEKRIPPSPFDSMAANVNCWPPLSCASFTIGPIGIVLVLCLCSYPLLGFQGVFFHSTKWMISW